MLSHVALVVKTVSVPQYVNSPSLKLHVTQEHWPFDKPFRIARGARTEAHVIVATVSDGEYAGRGEAVPVGRYGETVESAIAQLETLRADCVSGFDRQRVEELLPAGAARNALDCALWDFEAKSAHKRAWEIARLPVTDQVTTAFTISLDTPEIMAASARNHADLPLLKLKLGGDALDLARVEAVRDSAPNIRLIVDANESWSPDHYSRVAPKLEPLGVELIEQPFPAKTDDALKTLEHPVPVCADESCHTSANLSRLAGLYEAINVKLDKTGGLTEALRLGAAARRDGFRIMVGCMVSTSLGMAPARVLASLADYVDLDGPLLLARDRPDGLHYESGTVGLPSPGLWG